MTERLIDISAAPAILRSRDKNLVIEREGTVPQLIPLRELASVVLCHPGCFLSLRALADMARAGATCIVCDDKQLPVGSLMPLQENFVQAERFAAQARASAPLKKQLWRQIIRGKVRGQGRLLVKLRGDDHGLLTMASRVKSGDTTNVESQAAKVYWRALFADETFRRGRFGPWPNPVLNYGYAILRGMVGRAICAAGLHPSLGLHHHNRYNAFCLVDDVMEPFRVVVDEAVTAIVGTRRHKEDSLLTTEIKRDLVSLLVQKRKFGKESRTLFDIAGRTANSLVTAFQTNKAKISLPELP